MEQEIKWKKQNLAKLYKKLSNLIFEIDAVKKDIEIDERRLNYLERELKKLSGTGHL